MQVRQQLQCKAFGGFLWKGIPQLTHGDAECGVEVEGGWKGLKCGCFSGRIVAEGTVVLLETIVASTDPMTRSCDQGFGGRIECGSRMAWICAWCCAAQCVRVETVGGSQATQSLMDSDVWRGVWRNVGTGWVE